MIILGRGDQMGFALHNCGDVKTCGRSVHARSKELSSQRTEELEGGRKQREQFDSRIQARRKDSL